MSYEFISNETKAALEDVELIPLLDKFSFYLAGGTGLAFELKYRISYDLDFFTSKKFDSNNLRNVFAAKYDLSEVSTEEGTLRFVANKTNYSFFYYPYPILEDFNKFSNVSIASVLDIALMKITAIADRGLKKDFYDLYFAAKMLRGLDRILQQFKQKFPDANVAHYIKSLVFFDDAKLSPEPDFLLKVPTWEEIEKFFENEVKKMVNNRLV